MTIWESVRVAFKMLGVNKLRTGLTMLGIVIGVMERRGNSLGFDLDDVVFIPVSKERPLQL